LPHWFAFRNALSRLASVRDNMSIFNTIYGVYPEFE